MMSRISFKATLAIPAITLSFAVSTIPAAAWTESVLYNFKSGEYGYPEGRLLLNTTTGALSGTGSGFAAGYGSVFELTSSNGSWSEKMQFQFDVSDGSTPLAGLLKGAGEHFMEQRKTAVHSAMEPCSS